MYTGIDVISYSKLAITTISWACMSMNVINVFNCIATRYLSITDECQSFVNKATVVCIKSFIHQLARYFKLIIML